MAKCNLHCLYCKNTDFPVLENKTITLMETIFNKFLPNRTAFRVQCRGEITLYKKIIHYLELKCEEGYRIEILTNGLRVDKMLRKDTPLRLVISLDGHTEKMNRFRRLGQKQVNHIFENILRYKAQIQLVYNYQSLSDINAFIRLLKAKGYNNKLHIFPCSRNGKITDSIVYDKLEKASFLPPKYYFERWKYIKEYDCRTFVCDMIKNGYMYYICKNDIFMIKCDGTPLASSLLKPFGEEIQYQDFEFPCGNCINHSEYNNDRDIVKLN